MSNLIDQFPKEQTIEKGKKLQFLYLKLPHQPSKGIFFFFFFFSNSEIIISITIEGTEKHTLTLRSNDKITKK